MSNPPLQNPTKISQPTTEINPKNPCQGFQVDPITKLHLCQNCAYHQHRNETKPWVGKDKKDNSN